ncbi:MAG: FAD-dependent oxidoreductase [Acidimicrobiia bacterium]|nr:FAD-dependent oxidoreductase [Acidimicrobiia bacterium]
MIEYQGPASYWAETSQHTPGPVVTGRHDVDVAIVGGGFTGMWTAYQLLDAEPSMRVAVIEREVVGFGASGRNGGFAMTLLDMSLAHLRRNHGDTAAAAAHEAVAESVGEIDATIEADGIECEWKHGGLMVVATCAAQLERVEAELEAAEALGLDGFKRLSREEARAEVHSPTYVGGLREEHCGVVHPAKLVRGLARVVSSRGADVFEGTDVTTIEEAGGRIRVVCPQGEITADQVVLATNAWAAETPWFARKVLPLYTYIAMTEPLSDAQWDSVGWESHCGIEDKRNFVHYYRRTLDGRILWGGSDGIVYYGGRIAPRHDRSEGILKRLTATFHRTFPQLPDVGFTHHWGGPVGITVSFLPIFGTLLEGRLHYGLGYNGHGVAPSHTGGKILRDKVLGRRTGLTELCFVDSKEYTFPPEPLRWIGAELTRQSLLRQDTRFEAGRGSGAMEPLLLRAMRKLG